MRGLGAGCEADTRSLRWVISRAWKSLGDRNKWAEGCLSTTHGRGYRDLASGI